MLFLIQPAIRGRRAPAGSGYFSGKYLLHVAVTDPFAERKYGAPLVISAGN
jgi:hypothetical protein